MKTSKYTVVPVDDKWGIMFYQTLGEERFETRHEAEWFADHLIELDEALKGGKGALDALVDKWKQESLV
jgi:hypothetical protein